MVAKGWKKKSPRRNRRLLQLDVVEQGVGNSRRYGQVYKKDGCSLNWSANSFGFIFT